MIEGLFTLPKDVLLEPVESLPEAVADRFEHGSGDFALTRPQSRTPTHVVSHSTAKLLQCFREPVTIADAIISFSQREQADPGATLNQAFPMLRSLIDAGMLLPSDSQLASRIEFSIQPGELVGGLIVDQPVAVVIDTEVYRARAADGTMVALKIARPGAEDRLKPTLAHEAGILALLEGSCNPRLVAHGEHSGRAYLALEWCKGVDAFTAAELVRNRDPVDRRELKPILLAIVDAYARLHEQGVIHGDVHPRNVMVCESGSAAIIDFGYAQSIRDGQASAPRGRGGVDLYMEPELARARLDRRWTGAPTLLGEQYSIAALLYFLLTGSHTHDFVLEECQMLEQIIDDDPARFAERGISGLSYTEQVLRKALEKRPEARFASTKAFQEALHQALSRDDAAQSGLGHRNRNEHAERRALLEELIEGASLDGKLMATGFESPSASVNFGSAGLAYALLRIAQQRADASLLALADVWSQAALRDIGSMGPAALSAPDLEMSPELIGTVSFYHSVPGALCVGALVAESQSDEVRLARLVKQFAAAAAADEARLELIFGLAGPLLGCSLLLDAIGATSDDESGVLAKLGNRLSERIRDQLANQPSIGATTDPSSLGVAHGWAGILYAALQWAQVSKSAVSSDLQARLEQLADLAQPVGRGLAWPVSTRGRPDSGGMRPTWCNGAAGHLHLWLLAHELLDDPRYLPLAHGAAWTVYEAPNSGGDLCCGSAGRAYALLRYFRRDGRQIWLDRANQLADHAARTIRQQHLRKYSLYRGEVGVCLLAADLCAPNEARMPLFELG